MYAVLGGWCTFVVNVYCMHINEMYYHQYTGNALTECMLLLMVGVSSFLINVYCMYINVCKVHARKEDIDDATEIL